MKPNRNYPYQDLSLDDLEGEEWEDIPGVDGYFLISNFGRVKRQQYEMQYRNGAIHVKPEKIIKPAVVKVLNKFKKDYAYCLTTQFTLSGKTYSFTVARLVYYCFVQQFDLDDHHKVVLCQDQDSFNIHPGNLKMATLNEKQQRVVARKRMRSSFFDLTEEQRSSLIEAIIKRTSKQVTQYSLKGRKIKTFSSVAAAGAATGIHAGSIRNVATGISVTAGGFLWRWGKAVEVDVAAFKLERHKGYIEKRGQKVTQYDFTGKKIAQFSSVDEAAQAVGAPSSLISKVLNGKNKSAKGYFWKKGYGEPFIDLSDYKWGQESKALNRSKPVKQYSLQGNYIQTFPSIKEAAKSLGVHISTISGALNGRQHSSCQYKWAFCLSIWLKILSDIFSNSSCPGGVSPL